MNVSDAILAVSSLIKTKVLNIDQVNTMLNNMIKIYEQDEEFERCHICNQLIKSLN